MANTMKMEPPIKNKKAMDVSSKMGRRYSLLDAMLMGKRLGIDWSKEKFTVGDLLVGMHYELEHGKVDPETNVTNDNPKKTAKIAWAHLKERPDYYVQLMKIDPPHKREKKASADGSIKGYDEFVKYAYSLGRDGVVLDKKDYSIRDLTRSEKFHEKMKAVGGEISNNEYFAPLTALGGIALGLKAYNDMNVRARRKKKTRGRKNYKD